jgi:hypothetical protein
MAGFLDATRHRDYVRAAEFLDLRRLPAATHAQDGPMLARQLRIVLETSVRPSVDRRPISSTVPSLSPDRQKSPTRTG